MIDHRVVITWLVVLVLSGLAACSSRPIAPHRETAAVFSTPEPARSENPDQAKLKDALTGREMSPTEVADLSERLVADGNSALSDQETMARLELLILKSLKGPDKACRPVLFRNLGILHYHQKKYKQARQELQAANELNPKNARTHFYLARLFVRQGEIYEKEGKIKISKQQLKRAAIEMEQARKLEPSNPLYRQDLKQIIQRETGT